MMAESPVFIVGVGRSGTSLVQSMLAAHPDFTFLPETGFFRRYVSRGVLKRIAGRDGPRAVTARLASDDRLRRLDVSPRDIVAAASDRGPLTDVSIYRALLGLYTRHRGVTRAGDKDPRLVEHLALLSRVFPDAWVIHVIRDPRDVLSSKKAARWSRDRHVLRHIFAGRVQLRMGREGGRRYFGERYVEVFYEDVLRDPESTLRRLCKGISVAYDSAMLEFRDAAVGLVAPEEMSWKSETLGPLLTENIDKWRDVLTARETIMTEKACSEAMEAGGYQPAGLEKNLGLLDRVHAGLTVGVLAAAAPLYRVARRFRDAAVRV